MKDNYFNDILKKYAKKLIEALVNDYIQGSLSVDTKQPKEPTKEEIKLMSNKVSDLIKGVTEEDSLKINNIIRDSLLNRESRLQIAQKLDDVFQGRNPTKLSYKKRLNTIARTESVNFYNQGALKNALRLGATHKRLIIQMDKRTSCICETFYKKYGTDDKAIPINENFKVSFNGKQVDKLLPPCRSSVKYIFK